MLKKLLFLSTLACADLIQAKEFKFENKTGIEIKAFVNPITKKSVNHKLLCGCETTSITEEVGPSMIMIIQPNSCSKITINADKISLWAIKNSTNLRELKDKLVNQGLGRVFGVNDFKTSESKIIFEPQKDCAKNFVIKSEQITKHSTSFCLTNNSDHTVVVKLKENTESLSLKQHEVTLAPHSKQAIEITINRNLLQAQHPIWWSRRPVEITCTSIINNQEKVEKENLDISDHCEIIIGFNDNELHVYGSYLK